MRNKIILLIVVLIVIAIIYLNADMPITRNNVTNSSVIEPENNQPRPITIKNNKTKKQQDTINDTEEIVIIDAVYDTDPVIDANMILYNFKPCFEQIDDKLKSSVFKKYLKHRYNNKQLNQYQSLEKYCNKLNQEHPEYNLSNKSILTKQKNLAEATSLWGKIINGEIDTADLDDATIQELLKQNNLSILIDSQKLLKEYYLKVIHWDLEDVLANHQYDYVNKIRYYAHQKYLCTIGADCSPLSTTMMRLCYFNSRNCGLTYPNFIQNILTQGQQADIQLAFNYLQNQYR